MSTAPGPSMLAYPKQRFTESVKFLPVAFVSCNILGLYFIYMEFHCLPRYQAGNYPVSSLIELVVFNLVTGLLVMCYLWCILIHPGTIPEKEEDPSWEYVVQDLCESADGSVNPQEWKRSGDRRQCKWCAKYKPDRCHHCRVCRMCILKMDHHCPWIYNCVGFRNHKYFFLLLFYSTIDCHLIVWTMMGSVKAGLDPDTPFLTMFLLLLGETLASFLGVVVTAFFGFHIYLTLRAMTTIEFCEKSTKRSGYDANIYDRGLVGNVKAVLGDNIFFWFLPCSPPPGRGLSFITEDMRLTRDMEVGRSVRRRAHQKAEPAEPKRRAARSTIAGVPPPPPEPSAGTGSAPASAGNSEDEDEFAPGEQHSSGGESRGNPKPESGTPERVQTMA